MLDPTENRAAVQAVRPTDKEVLDVLAPFADVFAGGWGSALSDDFSMRICRPDIPTGGAYVTAGQFRAASDLHARLSQSTEAGPAPAQEAEETGGWRAGYDKGFSDGQRGAYASADVVRKMLGDQRVGVSTSTTLPASPPDREGERR